LLPVTTMMTSAQPSILSAQAMETPTRRRRRRSRQPHCRPRLLQVRPRRRAPPHPDLLRRRIPTRPLRARCHQRHHLREAPGEQAHRAHHRKAVAVDATAFFFSRWTVSPYGPDILGHRPGPSSRNVAMTWGFQMTWVFQRCARTGGWTGGTGSTVRALHRWDAVR
jgi:hypothetical protein